MFTCRLRVQLLQPGGGGRGEMGSRPPRRIRPSPDMKAGLDLLQVHDLYAKQRNKYNE